MQPSYLANSKTIRAQVTSFEDPILILWIASWSEIEAVVVKKIKVCRRPRKAL